MPRFHSRPARAFAFLSLCLLVPLACMSTAVAAKGVPVSSVLQAPVLVRQGAQEFRKASLVGAALAADGSVTLDAARAAREGGVLVGTVESEPVDVRGAFVEVVPSWNAVTRAGSWVTLEVRADVGGRWTRYYSFGRWTSGKEPARASLNGQGDADGDVLTDTLRLKRPGVRVQYRVRLYARDAASAPSIRLVTLAVTPARAALSSAAPASAAPVRSAWGRVLNVPARSQMLYPAGEGWCSPASVSMVLAYWGVNVTVPDAAAGTFDATYGGTGNWSFNVAYAATQGMTAFVTRYASLASVERLIVAGVPVVVSAGWAVGELPGAPIPKSDGHLMVVVGFDRDGNVIVNDPAGRVDAEVRRVYDRARLERLWLKHSGGTAYVIHPSTVTLPGM